MKRAMRKDLAQFVAAEPEVCRGGATFKGRRLTVADVPAEVERGPSRDFICL